MRVCVCIQYVAYIYPLTWQGRCAGSCRPCVVLGGVCVPSVRKHTYQSVGCWWGTVPGGCCCSPLIGWREAGARAYWPRHSGTANWNRKWAQVSVFQPLHIFCRCNKLSQLVSTCLVNNWVIIDLLSSCSIETNTGHILSHQYQHALTNWGCSDGKRECNSILGRCS
jgi:hypothetical protein